MKKTLTKIFLYSFLPLLFGCIGQLSARTVTWSGVSTSFTSKDGVTVVQSSLSASSKTITCLAPGNVSYLSQNSATGFISLALSNAGEKITAIKVIWMANAVDQSFPIFYGEEIAFTSSGSPTNLLNITKGGFAMSEVLPSQNSTNCANVPTITFPATVAVQMVYIPRLAWVDAIGMEDGVVPSFKARLNSSTSAGYTIQKGLGSTCYFASIEVTIEAQGPSVALTSGQAAATGMATLAIDPIVYTYSNVDDATLAWQSDAPSGISVVKDTEAKTLTISGTPTTAGVYGYTVSVADGNTLTGSLSVSAYATPTPEITTPANSSQSKKAGAAIEDIIYHFKHATGATVAGLPGGLTAVYADSKMTISGTLLAESSYPATYSYTVSAIPLEGYAGEVVTATATITVKDPSAKAVLYLAGGGTAQKTPDLLLNQLNGKYDVTLRAAQANFTGNYNDYDLIVLHESLTGNDAQAATHELAQIKGANKPILNTKSYFYTPARWNWGAASNGNSQSFVTMSAISPSHPIFEGIVGDTITLLSVDMAKNIQPITSFTNDGYKGYELATVPGGVAIHEIPAQGRGAGITAKYLMVSLLNDAFANLTTDGLKLLDNACAYLLSSAVYTPITVSVDQIISSELYFDGQMLHNPSSVSIELIDMAGRSLVRTSTSISLEQLNRGFYLVRELESGLQMKIVR